MISKLYVVKKYRYPSAQIEGIDGEYVGTATQRA